MFETSSVMFFLRASYSACKKHLTACNPFTFRPCPTLFQNQNTPSCRRVEYLGIRDAAVHARPIPLAVNISTHWPVYAVNDDLPDMCGGPCNSSLDALLLMGDVRQQPRGHADVPVVVVATNRGRVVRLFDNPHHADQLRAFGLRPDTGPACAFHYLFRPRREVMRAFAREFAALADGDVLKIGIHIRVGDRVFAGNDTVAWPDIQPYFDCATQIQAQRARLPSQRTLWYVASDSLAVRRMASSRFGSKVVTDITRAHEHTDCRSRVTGGAQDAGACQRQLPAMRQAAGDLLALSTADVHVYTNSSGFGRLASWLALAQNNHYAVDHGRWRKCGIADADHPKVDARAWSGI